MLDQLRLRVADIIRPKRPAAPAAAVAPPPAGDIDDDFGRRLRDVVQSTGLALAGRVNLLGLSRIKEHFGADWQRVAERAERIARNAIERRLTPRDIYGKWDDFDFVLIFTDLTPTEAQLKCTLLADEIARDLVGEDGAELIEVKTAVLRLDGEVEFESVAVKAALLEMLHRALEAEATAAPPAPDGDFAGLRIRYRPMWDPARRNAVVFQCLPMLDALPPHAGDPIAGINPALTARVDAASRQAVIAMLARLVREDQRLLLSLPVHFETLTRLSVRLDYVNALDRLDDAARRLLLFELLDLPPGVVQARLLELTVPLRVRAYGVVARVGLDWHDFAPLKESGLRAVGVDVAAHPGPDPVLIRAALRFEHAARKAGLVAYLRGVRSPAVVQATRGVFAYIDGDAVAPLTDLPIKINALDFPT